MRSTLNGVSFLGKALFDEGILLIEDQDGLFHLLHYPERERIGTFHDFHSLVVGVETGIQGKSDDLVNWLNTYWEEYFKNEGKLLRINDDLRRGYEEMRAMVDGKASSHD